MCVVDVFARIANKRVLWEESAGQASSPDTRIHFDGVPFTILGWQVLECSSGQHKSRKEKGKHVVSASHYTV